MNTSQKRSPRLSATGLILILIFAYLITLPGTKDVIGHHTDLLARGSSGTVDLSRMLSR